MIYPIYFFITNHTTMAVIEKEPKITTEQKLVTEQKILAEQKQPSSEPEISGETNVVFDYLKDNGCYKLVIKYLLRGEGEKKEVLLKFDIDTSANERSKLATYSATCNVAIWHHNNYAWIDQYNYMINCYAKKLTEVEISEICRRALYALHFELEILLGQTIPYESPIFDVFFDK